jgi:hypothetical protein
LTPNGTGVVNIGGTILTGRIYSENSDTIDFINSDHTGENIFLRSTGIGSGAGNPTGLISFGKHDSSSARMGSAIVGIQGTADPDQVGIAFYTSPIVSSIQTLQKQFTIDYDGTLIMESGGNIESTSNGDLSLIPNGTGLVKVGTGVPGHLTPTSGELYVQGKSEFDGNIYGDNGFYQGTANAICGHTSSSYGSIRWQATAQTVDTSILMTGTVSNAWVICENADAGYDFAHAQQTNPTLFIQSANQSATEWISFAHDQTNGVINTGTGSVYIASGSLDVVKSQAAVTGILVHNASDSNLSVANTEWRQGTAVEAALLMGQYSQTYATTAYQGKGVISTDTDSDGIVFAVRKATGDIRFFAGEAAPATTRMLINSTGISTYVDILSNGDISLVAGGSILSSSNGDISLVPNGTGVVYIGTGVPGHLTPTSGELYVQGKAEFDGYIYADAGLQVPDNYKIHFGTSEDVAILYGTDQTPDSWIFGVSTDSNGLIICQKGDITYDFAHALQTNPTLFIQSANQSATEWISFTHDQTDGLISAGTGLKLTTGANGDLVLDPNGTGIIDIQDDLKTDRWLDQDSNTFIGIGVAGGGTLAHTVGNEGYYNTALGYNCLNSITLGHSNVAIGNQCLNSTTTGHENVGVGDLVLEALQGGSYNTGLSPQALYSLTSGNNNIAIGFQSLYDVISTDNNVAIGYRSLFNVTGSGNIGIGYQSGDNIVAGDYNIIIGWDINAQIATNDYQINIGDVFKCANYASNGDVLIDVNGTGDFSVDTNSTERFSITGTTGIQHFPTTSMVLATRGTAQTITDNTTETVKFTNEQRDIRSEYNDTTGVFTAAEAGYYHCDWMVTTASVAWTSADSFFTFLSYNGSTSTTAETNKRGSSWHYITSSFTSALSAGGSAKIYIAAGATLEIKVIIDRGANTNTSANHTVNYFHIGKLA